MGFFILSFIILLLCIIIAIIGDKTYKEGLSITGYCIGIVDILVIISMSRSILTLPSDFQSYKNDYYNTKQLVESYQGGEYGNINSLTEKIIEINTRTAKHNAYHNNFWIGIWYSEEIGNLEPITFNNRVSKGSL